MLGYITASTGTAELNGVHGTYTFDDVRTRITEFQAMSDLLSGVDLSIFKQVVNGFYQAEGSLSVSFLNNTSSLVSPFMSFTQNVSDSSLRFLVMLQRILGVGTIRLSVTSAGKLHAALTIEN